jgi:hypothetical protein
MEFNSFIILFGTGVILLAFIVALWFTKKDKPSFFTYIFWAICIGLLLSVNAITGFFLKMYPPRTAFIVQGILDVIHSFYLGLFFHKILSGSNYKKAAYAILWIFTGIQILILIALINNSRIAFHTHTAASLMFVLFSIFYFRSLLGNNSKVVLYKLPVFFIVIGIFSWACISFPIYAFSPIVIQNSKYESLITKVFTLANILLIVMYLFFIKAYWCLKYTQHKQDD